jgi:SAM-dependent methyltransferase
MAKDPNVTAKEGSIVFYIQDIPEIPSSFKALLSTYSSVPNDSQATHIQSLRDRAYASHPYPCLGRWRFLELDMSRHPMYPPVLDLIKPTATQNTGPVFLDLGCCLGQDIRKLLLDVSPSLPPPEALTKRLFGADLMKDFIEMGWELFRDQEILGSSQFITPADVFDTKEGNALNKLDGEVNILHTGAFFHLFDLAGQKRVAKRCLRLLSRDGLESNGKKALIFGEQVGNLNPSEVIRRDGRMRYRHDPGSWKEMWEDVLREMKDGGETLGVKGVEVQNEMMLHENQKFLGNVEDGFRWHIWSVWVEFE